MTEQKSITPVQPQATTGMERVKNYMLSKEVKERFSEMMGPNGIYYLNQVLILVGNTDELQKCDPRSILISAMRAASLKLSVDPSSGQAWIIPYKGKATFQLGYKGVYELALRTNLYRVINVIDIYEGETLTENRMTGMHQITGLRRGDTVTARMLYFQLLNGFEKTFVMTVEEIAAHAKHYSQGYNNPRSKWHDPMERPKMERKTVLVNGLRKWGRFNPGDAETIDAIESEQGWMEHGELAPEEDRVTIPEKVKRTEAEIMGELYNEPAAIEADYKDLPVEPEFEPDNTGEMAEAVTSSPQPTLRLQPEALKTAITSRADGLKSQTIKQTQRGLIAATLEGALSHTIDPKLSRKQLLVYLTGKDSLADVHDNVALAIFKWLNPAQDSGGLWIADEMAAREARAALNACQPDQTTLF